MKKRNHIYYVRDLEVGDRFYKLNDKSKKVFQIVTCEAKRSKYPHCYFCCEANIADNKKAPQKTIDYYTKAVMGDLQVVFLRRV